MVLRTIRGPGEERFVRFRPVLEELDAGIRIDLGRVLAFMKRFRLFRVAAGRREISNPHSLWHSMFGVRMDGLPGAATVSNRWSSVNKNSTFRQRSANRECEYGEG